MAVVPLYVSSLKVPSDSLTIGPAHKQVLKETRDRMEHDLFRRRAELEGRVTTHPSRAESVALHPAVQVGHKSSQQETLDSLYQEYQGQLDQLYDRFQREWTSNPQVKDFPCVQLPAGEESSYMSKTVGLALTHALAEVCVKKPIDPIEYLSHLLRKYAKNVQQTQRDAVTKLRLQLAQEDEKLQVEHNDEMEREKKHIQQEEKRRKEIFLKSSPRPEEEGGTSPSSSPRTKGAQSNNQKGSDVTSRSADDIESNLYTIIEKDGEAVTGQTEDESD